MALHHSTTETWKPVPIAGFSDDYEVSDHGTIRRLRNCLPGRNGHSRALKGHICKQHKTKKGYMMVTLIVAQVYKTATVHGIVSRAFIGERPKGMEVNHKDGNKTNNHINNLEYVTPYQNLRHAEKTGLRKKQSVDTTNVPFFPNTQKGTENHFCKLTEKQVQKIRVLYATGKYTLASLGRKFNMTYVNIGSIVYRKTWKHI